VSYVNRQKWNLPRDHLQKMTKSDKIYRNISFKNGDILYVTPSLLLSIERFMIRFNNIIDPFVTVERAIIFKRQVVDVLSGKETNVILSP